MELEYIYREAQLTDMGISLEEFKRNPTGVLNQCGQESAIECIERGLRPLLSAQARAARRIQQEWAEQDRRQAELVDRNKRMHPEAGLFHPTLSWNGR